MSNRIEKVNSLLEHEIGAIIQREVHVGPDILVTLTHVESTANLIEAKVYISALPEEKIEDILKILRKETPSIQQQINKKLNMRPIPKIMFVQDTKIREAGKIEELLSKLKKEER